MRYRFYFGVLIVLVGALLLLWTAFLNGYPVVFDDTGSYILTSFKLQALPDRSIGYSLFILFTRFADTLWFVVGAQAIGTSYLLIRMAMLFVPHPLMGPYLAIGILIGTILMTGVSTFVGLAMPDVFASWLFLGTWLFLLSDRTYDKALAALGIVIAIFVHGSHILLAILFAATLTVGALLLRTQLNSARWRAVRNLVLLVTLAILALGLLNLSLGAGFSISRGAASFLTARLAETGVLSETLDANCPTEKWLLCGYREPIRSNVGQRDWFLWSSDSPFRKLGWDQGQGEQTQIVWHAFQCCLQKVVASGVDGGWKQFWKFKSNEDFHKQPTDYYVFTEIRSWYPNEFEVFTRDVQETAGSIQSTFLPFNEESVLTFFLLIAIVLSGIFLFTKNYPLAVILLSMLAFITFNAFVTGALSGVYARYQGRVIWLVPYCVLLAMVSFGRQCLRLTRPSPVAKPP